MQFSASEEALRPVKRRLSKATKTKPLQVKKPHFPRRKVRLRSITKTTIVDQGGSASVGIHSLACRSETECMG
jgi:hypothetical protein